MCMHLPGAGLQRVVLTNRSNWRGACASCFVMVLMKLEGFVSTSRGVLRFSFVREMRWEILRNLGS